MKLGEIAASFLPRVIISPRFWNLVVKQDSFRKLILVQELQHNFRQYNDLERNKMTEMYDYHVHRTHADTHTDAVDQPFLFHYTG